MTQPAPLLPSFDRVYVEITNRCNLRCAFCAGTNRPPASMDPDFFAAVLAQVRPLTGQVCLHVLGEPLLHPELPRILEHCAAAGLLVNLTTNGTLLPGLESVLLGAGALRQINFSLQALMRGDDLDQHALDAVLAFARRLATDRPGLYVNFRLWTLDSLADPGSGADATRILERLARALDIAPPVPPPGRKSLRLRGRLYLHQDTAFAWPGDLTTPELEQGFCHALSTHCAILADGTVCPCCLDADGGLALGSLREASLTDILAAARATAMRQGFAAGRLVETLCRHCTYCRRFTKHASARRPAPRRNP